MSFGKLFAAVFFLFLSAVFLTGCGPMPDKKRIAADEARGIRFSADKRTLVSYDRKLPDREYVIPRGVTVIGKKAFHGCNNLTNVTIPMGVTTIGEGAFDHCPGLKDVTIPPSVTTIGRWAFAGCGNLRSVNFPSVDMKIGLKTVTIHPGIRNIGANAFFNCENLTEVDIPSSLTSIGRSAFLHCPCESSVKRLFPSYVSDR